MISRRALLKGVLGLAGAAVVAPLIEEPVAASRFTIQLDQTMLTTPEDWEVPCYDTTRWREDFAKWVEAYEVYRGDALFNFPQRIMLGDPARDDDAVTTIWVGQSYVPIITPARYVLDIEEIRAKNLTLGEVLLAR